MCAGLWIWFTRLRIVENWANICRPPSDGCGWKGSGQCVRRHVLLYLKYALTSVLYGREIRTLEGFQSFVKNCSATSFTITLTFRAVFLYDVRTGMCWSCLWSWKGSKERREGSLWKIPPPRINMFVLLYGWSLKCNHVDGISIDDKRTLPFMITFLFIDVYRKTR